MLSRRWCVAHEGFSNADSVFLFCLFSTSFECLLGLCLLRLFFRAVPCCRRWFFRSLVRVYFFFFSTVNLSTRRVMNEVRLPGSTYHADRAPDCCCCWGWENINDRSITLYFFYCPLFYAFCFLLFVFAIRKKRVTCDYMISLHFHDSIIINNGPHIFFFNS